MNITKSIFGIVITFNNGNTILLHNDNTKEFEQWLDYYVEFKILQAFIKGQKTNKETEEK